MLILLAMAATCHSLVAAPLTRHSPLPHRSILSMQQNSGSAKQRHKMMGKQASMKRMDKQRGMANNVKFTKKATPAKPPPQGIGGTKVLAAKTGFVPQKKAPQPADNGTAAEWSRDDTNGGVDEARVEMIVSLRAQAQATENYNKADELREVLRAMAVDVFDKERVWSLRAGPAPSICALADEPATPSGVAAWLRSAVLVTCLLLQPGSAALAALPPDTSGTWAITETRGGQKCTATLMLQPTRAPQSAEETRRGAARYQGVCVDSADGSWIVQEGANDGLDGPPRLAWRLDYEKSVVFFAFDVKSSPTDGALIGRGDVFAAPKANPKGIAKVGGFEARRVSSEWDMRNPVIARRVTDKELPTPSLFPKY